jgi:hypothetical protein
LRKFSFLVTSGGHSGESLKWGENCHDLGVFTRNSFFHSILQKPIRLHRFFVLEKEAPSLLGRVYKSKYFWNLKSGPILKNPRTIHPNWRRCFSLDLPRDRGKSWVGDLGALARLMRASEVQMSKRFYDAEFAPGILVMLKERDILMRANRAQRYILVYNLATEAELLIRRFDEERKANPVLETTPPEAWIAAKLVPNIREIRPNIDTDDELLSEAIQRILRRFAPLADIAKHCEQVLSLTIEPYRPCLETLFRDLFDRTKGVRSILGLRRATYNLRDFERDTKPFTMLGTIFLQGIRERWSNRRIAITLDEAGVQPRNPEKYKSYVHMLGIDSHSFYSLKNNIKTKYRTHLMGSVIPTVPNLN